MLRVEDSAFVSLGNRGTFAEHGYIPLLSESPRYYR